MSARPLNRDPLNLIVTGVGGQGNVMISLIVGNALVSEGYFVTVGETYGMSQRGGPVMSHLRVSDERQHSPFIPEGCADVILGMEPAETLRMLGRYGNLRVVTIVNPRPIYSIDVTAGLAEYPEMSQLLEAIEELSAQTWIINATEEAQKLGDPMFANAILIGALIGSGLLPVDRAAVEGVLSDTFPKQIDTNLAAFSKGFELLQ